MIHYDIIVFALNHYARLLLDGYINQKSFVTTGITFYILYITTKLYMEYDQLIP